MNELSIRRSEERGHADHGWLKSKHTFSFADYRDPAHMGFRSLRVINQDKVDPGAGFPTHPHRDMEIFSYVLEGTLKHRDSMGNGRELKPGEIQLMSAGAGVTHSEFNPSDTELLHFLQIWIHPDRAGYEPSYTEWHPNHSKESQAIVPIITRDGREGSAKIRQDADIFRVRLSAGESVPFELSEGRGIWIQVITGILEVNGTELREGDGGFSESPGEFTLKATENCEVLLFDLR
ncbi:MAG: pirin family protein [Verrucomicrobiota bacterium]